MDLFVELELADTSDPFRDPDFLHPKAGEFRFEDESDEVQLVRGQLASYAVLTRGVSFAFTLSVFFYAEYMRGSFVGI